MKTVRYTSPVSISLRQLMAVNSIAQRALEIRDWEEPVMEIFRKQQPQWDEAEVRHALERFTVDLVEGLAALDLIAKHMEAEEERHGD